MCVATSDDGAAWSKPALGLIERAGRADTNITAYESGQPFMGYPWLDSRPGVPEHERIKALNYTYDRTDPCGPHAPYRHDGPVYMWLYVSADGFTFRKLAPEPVFASSLPGSFDGGNVLFWSQAEQTYLLYYRYADHDSAGSVYRSMARATSRDLLHWEEPVPMTYGDTPREQFYMNQTQPYFRAPHIYVAPAARFMQGRRVLTAEQAKAIGLTSPGGLDYGGDCSDGVLLTSRAGSTQYDRTFMETFIRPGLGASNWVSRTNYPVTGILPCGPERMMLFVSRHNFQETIHVERLLLRTDGFASVAAPWAGGELITKPFTFQGQRLEINYRTGAPGFLRVEIQDAAGAAIPGYALHECPEIIGDEIARTVAWEGGADVGRLTGRPVRLRLAMKDADLFALRFCAAS